MDIFTGVNLFEMTLTGNLLDTYSTTSYSFEPTGVDYNPVNGHLFISDDVRKKIYELAPGSDGLLFTTDDSVTSFSTTLFGSIDPEGVAFDSRRGVLLIVDGVNEEVYQVYPGINGVFDGVAPSGDDQVNNFDTTSIGITDPEGIAYNSENGLLYIVGTPKGSLAEVSIEGTLIQIIDISTPLLLRAPDGLSFAPGSLDPSAMNIYITDKGVDNDNDPDENDGKVYEMSFPFTTTDVNPPEVQSVSPSDGALGVVVTTPLVITFSEVVNTGTFTYTLAPDPGDWVETWSAGNTVVTLSHDTFIGGTVYSVSVTAADDLAGNPLGWAPVTWNFTTVYSIYLPITSKVLTPAP